MVVLVNMNFVFLHDSPKWLRTKGFTRKADLASEYFHDSSPLLHSTQDDEIQITNSTSELNDSNLSQKKFSYFTWPILRPLLVCTSSQSVAVDGGRTCGRPPSQKYPKNLVVQLLLLGPKFRLLFVTRECASGGSRGGIRGIGGIYPPTIIFGSMSVDLFFIISLLVTIIPSSKYTLIYRKLTIGCCSSNFFSQFLQCTYM